MNKFTHGKWQACEDGSIDILDENGKVLRSYANIVFADTNVQEDLANTRLIAHAPEMYETLQSLVGVLSVHSYSQEEAVKICQLLARIDGEETEHE